MNRYFFITQEGNSTQGNFQAANFQAASEGLMAHVAPVRRAVLLENARVGMLGYGGEQNISQKDSRHQPFSSPAPPDPSFEMNLYIPNPGSASACSMCGPKPSPLCYCHRGHLPAVVYNLWRCSMRHPSCCHTAPPPGCPTSRSLCPPLSSCLQNPTNW